MIRKINAINALVLLSLSGTPAFSATPGNADVEGTHTESRSTTNIPSGRIPPGFDEAASTLGVTTDELMKALQNPEGGQPNFSDAAQRLGISENELRAILPPPPGRR